MRYVGSCGRKGAITLPLLMRDEKAVCSRLRDTHVVASVTRILEASCRATCWAGFVDLGLGLGVWFCVLRIFVFKTVSGVMHYLVFSVRKPTPNSFCGDVPNIASLCMTKISQSTALILRRNMLRSRTLCKEKSQALVSRKPTLPPKPLPILKKQIGKRHHADRQERQQARGPLIAKLPVHLHAKKWECR